ncbi:MAG: methyltransferase domain-containing protein [Acidobacteriota bacterium]|nr:methyltransferase domain-containing protein [Acidobacteriota bacterium]
MSRIRGKYPWYLPGRIYDFALGGLLRGFRSRVAAEVGASGLYPWLDICCGTGSQFRNLTPGLGYDSAFGLDLNFNMVRYAAARTPGRPFVCGDAACLPFKAGSFRTVSVSFGLHEKSPAVRQMMMDEAKRLLAGDGRLVTVDFENPWNLKSSIGSLPTRVIERLAGGDHYRNCQKFLRRGGLRAFLRESGFVECSRRDIEAGSISIVVSRVGVPPSI